MTAHSDLQSTVDRIAEPAAKLAQATRVAEVFNKPFRCLACKYVCEQENIPSVLVLKGVYSALPENCYPDERETKCPECGAHESFEDGFECQKCDCHPCMCGDEE